MTEDTDNTTLIYYCKVQMHNYIEADYKAKTDRIRLI